MTKRRLLSIILVCLIILPVLFGCADKTEETGTTAPDTTAAAAPNESTAAETDSAYVADSLPDKMDLNRKIGVLYDDKASAQEFFADDTNGEAINDAIYARNAAIEARLNVTFEFTGCHGNNDNQNVFLDKAKSDTDGAFDIYGAYSRTTAYLAANGLCYNLVNTEYFDIEKPWWPQALTDECLIKGKLFFCSGDISTNLLWYMSALFFNLDIWENARQGESLYDLVDSKQWIYDKFFEICRSFYDDLNGNQIADVGDQFGICGYDACFDAFLNSSGVISIIKDSSGSLILNPDFLGERTVDIVGKVAMLCKDSCCHYSGTSKDEKAIFYDGKALFALDGAWLIGNGGGNLGFKFGMIPLPLFDADQENYITNIRYPFNIYAVSNVGENKDESSAVLEAWASASYRMVTPIVFEVTMKTRYSEDTTASRMFDILRSTVCFDLGRVFNYSLGNYYPSFRKACFANSNWAQTARGIATSTNRFLTTLMKIYD